MPPVRDTMTPQEADAFDRVTAAVESFEGGIGVDFKERCEKFYRQYRGFKRFRYAWEAAAPNDRDTVLSEAKSTWGSQLHIPLSFRTIETMVPRAIANRPRLLYLPRSEEWEDNVESVRMMIDAQQDRIDIELPFQDVMRTGMIYGLGVGKSYWRREYASRRRVKKKLLGSGYTVGQREQYLEFDDPYFENVDVFDFMWDPFGHSMRTCGWVVHRTWLSLEGCLSRIESGRWNTQGARSLTEEDLRALGNGQKYTEVWDQRMQASGFTSYNKQVAGEQIHEVWEYHDGDRVLTVLDRQVLVQDAENPCVGMLPFCVYRPTRLPNQMVGIGEIEPVEHLQRELDTLRSQRRDAATLALCAGYAYDDGAIDDEDLVLGPAAAIRVRNASPRDAIMPLQVKDIPGSGYQEEQVIRGDFDGVTGINDALAGGDGGAIGTATEAQLVQASLSKRVEMKSRGFEVEVAKDVARQWLYLNQRMIVTERPPIRQPGEGLTLEQASHEGRWRWFPQGPAQIAGEFEIQPEGGSMAAENVPQMRQDFSLLAQMEANPHVDPRKITLKRLSLLGIKNAESWLTQQDPPVPPKALEILARAGVSEALIRNAVTQAQRTEPMFNEAGPDAQQVGRMMGDGAPPSPDQAVAA